jgi:ribosomal-protein-alanine N-acetyltransferase
VPVPLATARLTLRPLGPEDAPFVLDLMSEPTVAQNVGRRPMQSLTEARNYIAVRGTDSYVRHGFGMYLVCIRDSGVGIGISGLVRREGLEEVDLGFALLPRFQGVGYATESALAVMQLARDLRLPQVAAVTAPENRNSARVLQKLGFAFARSIRLPGDDADLAMYLAPLRRA